MLNKLRDLTMPELVLILLMFIQTTCGAFVMVWMGSRLTVAPHDVYKRVIIESAEIQKHISRLERRLDRKT